MTDLLDDLRAQMRAATEADLAPAGLAGRARTAVRRRRQRGAVVLTTLAVAGTALVAVPSLQPGEGVRTLPGTISGAVEADPVDGALATADWWGFRADPLQVVGDPAGAELYRGRYWTGRDGTTVQLDDDGSSTRGPGAAGTLGGRSLSWEEVRALPDASPAWAELLPEDPASAFSEGVGLLVASPLDAGQRTALVAALAALPGASTRLVTGTYVQGAETALERTEGELRTVLELSRTARVVSLRRTAPGAERFTRYSGWTTQAPPEQPVHGVGMRLPTDEQIATADWWGWTTRDGDGEELTSWYGRDGSTVQQLDDGTTTSGRSDGHWRFGDRVLDLAGAQGLSDDPEDLAAQIVSAGGTAPAAERAFDDGVQLLATAPLTDAQRRALGQVVRGLDGVQVQGGQQDALGRPGERWRFARADGSTTEVLFGDPGRGRRVLALGDGPGTTLFLDWTTAAPEGFTLTGPEDRRPG